VTSVFTSTEIPLQFLGERFTSPVRFLETGVFVLSQPDRDFDLLNHPLRNIDLRHEGPSRECPITRFYCSFSHASILAHNVRILNLKEF
jgi:hypothetical protein